MSKAEQRYERYREERMSRGIGWDDESEITWHVGECLADMAGYEQKDECNEATA